MKILHLANHHSSNVGNGALVYGLERVLREDWGGELQFDAEPWDDYTLTGTRRFDEAFVERVNRYDAWLVGAAVGMNAWADFPNAGFRVDLPHRLWAQIQRPIIFYGLSYRVWPSQPYPYLEQFKTTMRLLLDNPRVVFSVRNDGTKEWLEGLLGFKCPTIESVPDPAMYVPAVDSPHPELMPGRPNVILSLNNEDEVQRYGGRARERAWGLLGRRFSDRALSSIWRRVPRWDASRTRMLKGMAAAFDAVAKEVDFNLILACHTFDDFKISHEFLSYCSRRLAYQKTVAAGVWHMSRAQEFYDLYAKADAAVSMRVHSMSPSLGLGVPTTAVCTQKRMHDFMEDMGLGELSLDAFDPGLGEKLKLSLRRCLDENRETRALIRSRVAAARERSRAFHERLGALVRKPA